MASTYDKAPDYIPQRTLSLREIKRELAMRGGFYQRQIEARKLTKYQANYFYYHLAQAANVLSVMTEAEWASLQARYQAAKGQQTQMKL